jgi:hypothetical protein
MAIRVVETAMTSHMQPHERQSFYDIRDMLNRDHEHGTLIIGKLEYIGDGRQRDDDYGEIDGILVLPDMVLLLDLKRLNVAYITIAHGDAKYFHAHSNRGREDIPNLIRPRDKYVCSDIKTRLSDQSILVRDVFVVDSPNRHFHFRLGDSDREKKWDLFEEVPVCMPHTLRYLIAQFRARRRIDRASLDTPEAAAHAERLTEDIARVSRHIDPSEPVEIGSYRIFPPAVLDDGYVAVFQGEEKGTDEPVWLKRYRRDVLAPGVGQNPDTLLELREAKALSAFKRYERLVSYKTRLESLDRGSDTYVVLEREEGMFLRERMRDGLTPAGILRILADILEGLAYIHSVGVDGSKTAALCRDVRPEGIFVTDAGRAKLFNFDCSRIPGKGTIIDRLPTERRGWQDYASLELLGKRPTIDTPTDVFSWGVVAYELLTGNLPFAQNDHKATRKPTPLAPDPHIPEDVQRLIVQALAPDPRARPRIDQLRAALGKVLPNEGAPQ